MDGCLRTHLLFANGRQAIENFGYELVPFTFQQKHRASEKAIRHGALVEGVDIGGKKVNTVIYANLLVMHI